MTNKKKKELKEQKINELEQIFKRAKENQRALLAGLIEQAGFMYAQLKELNEIIEKKGTIEKFKQGKQEFLREQPALKAYNATMKSYNTTIKQLSESLPPGNDIKMDDDFTKFKEKMRQ
ncbi:MAG: hypothetical protein HFJ52_04115 [Clostridia bacterium]|nr:hypothetical protein [Clostridia bacterium]